MIIVAIATCAELPELDPDDHLLVGALRDLGATVLRAVWNDVAVHRDGYDLCIVRSTWHYHAVQSGARNSRQQPRSSA